MYAEVQYYIIFPKMRYEYGPNDLYLSVMNPTPRIALFVGPKGVKDEVKEARRAAD